MKLDMRIVCGSGCECKVIEKGTLQIKKDRKNKKPDEIRLQYIEYCMNKVQRALHATNFSMVFLS